MKKLLTRLLMRFSRRSQKVDRAAFYIADKYGETFDLLAKYDKGQITAPESVANSGSVSDTLRSIRQVLR